MSTAAIDLPDRVTRYADKKTAPTPKPAGRARGKPPAPLTEEELAAGVPCPLCAYYGDTPNAETIAAIEEGEAILRGDIPGIRFNSAEEMFRYLEI